MYKYVKRILDITLSTLALILLCPIFLIIALAIKIETKGKVIFKQDRIGKDKKVFKIYKFSSMYEGAESTGSGVYSYKGDTRVTKVGKVIRATSLDELPQLINVIKGDMSLIGPRPPLTFHPWKIEEYSSEQLKMFNVRPGLTGYAQINGRKNVEWNKRIEMNCYYVDNMSFLFDTKIFFKTIAKVFSGKDNINVKETVEKNKVKQKEMQ